MRLKLRQNPYSARFKGILLIVAAGFAYCLGDIAVKIISARYNIFEMVMISGAIIPMLIFVKVTASRQAPLLKTSMPGFLVLRGLMSFLHFTVCYYAYAHMPVMNAYSLLFFAPILVTVMSAIFLKEKVGWQIWLAVFVGFCGILVMLRPGLTPMEPAVLVAMMIPFTSSACTILMRYASRTETNDSILFYSGSVLSFCALIAGYGKLSVPSLTDAGLFLFLGVMTTGGLFCTIQGYRLATTPVGAPFQYTQLVWGTLFGWVVWNTLPDIWHFAGMAVVVASGLFTLWHEVRLKRQADLKSLEPASP